MSPSADPVPAREPLSVRDAGAWLLLFALAAALLVYPLGWTADLLPDNADGVHSSWVLAWLARQLPRDPLGLLDANVLHPEERALAFSEHVISAGPLALPFHWLTGSGVLAHNATLIASLALTAFATLLLVRELTGSVAAGVVAGEVFALTTANFDSVARIQIVSSQWTPLTLYFLCRTLRTRRYADGIACGVAFALQGLASAYYELFFALLLALAAPLFVAAMPSPRLRSFPWLPLLAGAAIAALALLPVNLAQWETLSRLDSARAPRPTQLAAYWSALPGNWLYGSVFGAAGAGYDNRYFHGFLPLSLAALGAALAATGRWRRQLPEWGRRLALPFAWIGGLAFVLAFGPELPTPWGSMPGPLSWLSGWLPGTAEVRVPSRYIMFVRLSLAVFAGIGVAALMARVRRASPAGALAVLVALAVLTPLEHLSIPLGAWRVPAGERVPPVYRWLEQLPGRPAIVEYPPFPVRLRRDESLWEYLSTFHWKPLVNGYPSFYPVHYDFVYNALLDLPSPLAFDVLRVLGVEYLVYHPRASGVPERVRAAQRFEERLHRVEGRQLELVARFDRQARPAPDRRGVLGDERVYRVLPAGGAPRARPRLREGAPISRDGWRCASRPTQGCESALDGDLATAFETGSPQRPLDFLRVTFPQPTRVSGLALVSGVRSQFYPTRTRVSGLVDGEWRTLPHRAWELEFLLDMLEDPRSAALELHLRRPAVVAGVEVMLLPSHQAFNPWHVLELQAYP
jgi:hypothetical protein